MFVDLTENYLEKYINMYDVNYLKELLLRMLRNSVKDWLCYLPNESVSSGYFLMNMHEVKVLT